MSGTRQEPRPTKKRVVFSFDAAPCDTRESWDDYDYVEVRTKDGRVLMIPIL